MKLFSVKEEPKPQHDDYKIVVRFAWVPKKIAGEIVWLEKYKEIWHYTVRRRTHGPFVWIKIYHSFELVSGQWDLVQTKRFKK